MSYDNSPLLVERNERGFWCRAEQIDQAKSALGLSYILAQGAPNITLTGNTSLNILLNITVPGGLLLNPGSSLRIATMWSGTAGIGVRTTGFRFATTIFNTSSFMPAPNVQARLLQDIWTNSAGAIIGAAGATGPHAGTVGAPPAPLFVDLNQDQVIGILGQLTNAADNLTLDAFRIEAFPV